MRRDGVHVSIFVSYLFEHMHLQSPLKKKKEILTNLTQNMHVVV